MADGDDKIVSILIKFGLDDAAAKQAAAEMQGLGGGVDETAGKTRDLGDAFTNFEKRAESGAGQSREMVRIFGELNRITPGLGDNLRAAMLGGFAEIGAVLVMFNLFITALEKARQRAAELNEELAKEQTAVWDDQLDGLKAVNDEQDRYLKTLQEINQAKTDSNQLERDRNELLQAQFEAQQKILKAQETAELAAAGDDEVKKAQIRQRYEDTRSQDELKEEAKKVAAAKNDADRAAYTNSQDQDALAKAHAAAVSALDPNSPAAIAAAKAKPNIDFLNKQNDTALQDLFGRTGATNFADAAKIVAQEVADAQKGVSKAEATGDPNDIAAAREWLHQMMQGQYDVDFINKNNEAIAKDQSAIDAHTNAVTNAKNAEEQAATAAIAAAKKAQETADAYATAIQILKINTDAAGQAQRTQTAGTFTEAINAATSAPGTRLTTEQQAAIGIISDAFQKMHGNFIVWIQYLVQAVQTGHMTLAQEQAVIQQTLAQLQAQMANQK